MPATTTTPDLSALRREALEASARARKERNLFPSAELPLAIRLLVDTAVSLAAEAPAIAIRWVEPRHARAAKRLQDCQGIAFVGVQTILTPAIATQDDALTAFHELGHVRTRKTSTKLAWEIDAWQWTRRHFPWWSTEERDLVRPSLDSHVAAHGIPHALDLLAVDEFLSDEATARHYRSREAALDTYERREFARAHGPRDCESGLTCARRASAQRFVTGLACCRKCAEARELDVQMAAMRSDRRKARAS